MTAEKREYVSILVDAGLSIVKACLFVGIDRATFYRSKRDWRKVDAAVIDAINAVLKKSQRAGFWKCFGRMRAKGLPFNHKSDYRVYCQMGLNLRRRTLNVVDEGTRECLAVEVDTSLPAGRVVHVLEQLKAERGLPTQLRIDNGPALISATLTGWCETNDIELFH